MISWKYSHGNNENFTHPIGIETSDSRDCWHLGDLMAHSGLPFQQLKGRKHANKGGA